LPINEAFIVNGEYFSKEDGYNAMQKLLALKELPTAVFCASDMLAIGAIQAIQQANLSVPEDISIIGFDGIDIGQIFSPRLTTIRQDSRKMGKIAASNILTMISENNFKKNNTIMVDTYLITGETTRVLR
jgi:LacI family transcriptional regulator